MEGGSEGEREATWAAGRMTDQQRVQQRVLNFFPADAGRGSRLTG